MNLIVIKGRLAHEPELKKTASDVSVCNIDVAVNRTFQKAGEDKQADFFKVIFWRERADFVAKYFTKGQEILITGEMQSRKYEDKEGNNRTVWEIQASNAEFCGSKAMNTPEEHPKDRNPEIQTIQQLKDKIAVATDDDLPF